MKTEKAAGVFNRLTAFRGEVVPPDLREAVTKSLVEDRIVINWRTRRIHLRLEHPLDNGVAVLKARGLSVAERATVKKSLTGVDRDAMPARQAMEAISIMTGVETESLVGLGENDASLLIGLASFVS
jgi:hypothetical protein